MSLPAAAPSLVQAMSDAVVPARLEVMAFAIAMLMYALLVWKRIPEKDVTPKKEQQDIEDPPNLKAPSASKAKQEPRNFVAKRDVDVAKHVVMIRKCASAKDLKGAEAIFETLKGAGAKLDSIIYKTMIEACVSCQNLTAAHAWMDQARRVGVIDVASFNTILKAHVLNKEFETARSIVREMRHSRMQPNVALMNELISAAVNCVDNKEIVWAVVDEMREAGLAPNQVTCSALLRDLTDRTSDDDIRRAMDLVEAVSKPMDEILISSVIDACLRIGKDELLSDKLKDLEDGKHLAIKSSHTFGTLIKAYGYKRDLQGVWRQWKAMRAKSVQPTSMALGCMVEALVRNGCTEDAFDLVQRLQKDPKCYGLVTAAIYGLILKGFADGKKSERVWDVYQKLEENHPEMSHAREIQACLMQT